MKSISFISLLSLLFSFSLAAQDTAEFATYDKEGVKLSYPTNWAMTENVMGAKVMFQAPVSGTGAQIPGSVSLVIQEIPDAGMTPPLKDVAEMTKSQLKLMVTDFEEVSSEPITINEKDGYEIVYTGKQGEYELKWLQIFCIEGQKVYVLTYNTTKEGFDKDLETAQKIIDSFEF